ncbi:MAG: metallophosphoesterase family protein [Lachnospiraceae bacterium]|nr:metallophosphoesterase family protein [Lachnospiraceae bacterium]
MDAMKYAVLSDIHGNAFALKAVLEDAKKKGITDYIVAGDYCLSGPWPDECISILRGLENSHIIRGNEEQYLENLIGKDQSGWTDGQMQISYWCYKNIKEENLKYLLNLPHTIDFECLGTKIHVAHSRFAFMSENGMDGIRPSTLAKAFGDKPLDPATLEQYVTECIENAPWRAQELEKLEDGVYVFGHTHIQWSYKVKDRNVYLINPGSCGLPLDGVVNSIPYAVLELTDDGAVSIEKCRIPYDTEQYIDALTHTTQFTQANVWSKVIIEELKSAKEHLTFFLQFANQYADEIGDPQRPFSVKTWEAAYDAWINRAE